MKLPDTLAKVRRGLRKPVWFAFVASEPKGLRFLNKSNGDILLGQKEAPEGEWIPIEPLGSEYEKRIAIDFLKNNNLREDDFSSVLEKDRWFVEFPNALHGTKSYLPGKWKRERSRQVVELVQEWCSKNEIPEKFIFDDYPKAARKPSQVQSNCEPEEKCDDLRKCLLDAIKRMSTDELTEIRIPVQHLVAVLRPDLLPQAKWEC